MDFKAQLTALIAQLRREGIDNEAVLAAMAATPRHLFVDERWRSYAYEDAPLEIGYQQTISQPYIVAFMTQALLARGPIKKVLEIGTGSGYQAAVLSHLVDTVYTVERIEGLLIQAQARFKTLNLTNIHSKHADGHLGWPEMAPFDGIIVTAAATVIPQALLDQLSEQGGRMVIPVAENLAEVLKLVVRKGQQYEAKMLEWVRFVPLMSGVQ